MNINYEFEIAITEEADGGKVTILANPLTPYEELVYSLLAPIITSSYQTKPLN